jgi:hypothetical protein
MCLRDMNIGYNVGPTSYVCWFINSMNIHEYYSYKL